MRRKFGIILILFSKKNMGIFGQMKDMYKMQKKAKQMQKEMKNIEVEAEEGGVLVVVTAAQDLVEVNISDELFASGDKKSIEKNIKIAFDRANKKAQKIAAEKIRPIMGEMGLGG